VWRKQGTPVTRTQIRVTFATCAGGARLAAGKEKRPAKEAPGREWVINGQLLAGGASAIKRTQMQVILRRVLGGLPARKSPAEGDRAGVIGHVTGLLISQVGSDQEKARPRGAAAGRRSRCCPPVVGRRTVEIMRPIRWVMQHCGHTQVVGEAILWPSCGRPATLRPGNRDDVASGRSPRGRQRVPAQLDRNVTFWSA